MAQAGNIVANLQLKVNEFKQGMEDAQHELSSFSKTTQTIAKGATAAFAVVTAAIVGVTAAAANLAMETQEYQAKMQAATGATSAEMEKFGDIADNLFKAGRGNYEDIYSTLTTVKQILGQTGSEAEATADKALIMSKAFGWDITESVRAADSAQKAWGASSNKSFDMFTALAQQAGDKSDDLLDTFNEYSPTLATAGFSMETFGDALKAGMDAGAYNFDKIGDAMKEFSVRITDGTAEQSDFAAEVLGSKEAADAFFKGVADGSISGDQALKMITKGLGNVNDESVRMQAGQAFFGSMWEDLGGDVVMAMGQAEGALKNVEGATARAGEVLDQSLSAKITRIRNEFMVWAKDLGESFMPQLQKIADWFLQNLPSMLASITPVFQALGNGLLGTVQVLQSIVGFVQQNATAFTILAGVISAVVIPSLLGFILNATVLKTKALISLIASTSKLIATNYMLGLSYLAANLPLLAVIAAVGLLIAAFVLFSGHGDVIIAKLQSLGLNMDTFKGFIEGARAKLAELWALFQNSAIFEVIMNLINSVILKFQEFANAIKTVVTSGDFTPLLQAFQMLIPTIIGLLMGGIPKLVIMGLTMIQNLANGMGMSVPQLIQKVADIIVQMINQFVAMLPQLIQTGVQVLTSLIDGIVSALPSIINAVTQVITTLTGTIAKLLPKIIQAGVQVLLSLIKGIIQILPQLVNTALTLINALVDMLIQLLPMIIAAGISILLALIDGIIQILPQLIQTAVKLIISIVNTIAQALPQIIQAGIQILMALINGIIQILPQLISAILQLVAAILKTLISNLPAILEAGVKLILALIKGILSLLGAVGKAALDIGKAIVDKLKGIDLKTVGVNLIKGLWNGISSMSSWISGKLKGFSDNVLKDIKSFFGIHSPSRVFRDEIGVNLMKGLQVGIDNEAKSPVKSLNGVVGNVLDGAKSVKGAFDGLSRIRIATPQVGNVTGGYVNVDEVFGGDNNKGDGGNGTQYNAPIVQVENMNVRDDQDVRNVSRELFNLQRNHDRSQGGR